MKIRLAVHSDTDQLIRMRWDFTNEYSEKKMNVYTLPDYRGQRIGSRILKDIECWSKDNGYEFIIVWPSDRSVEFYARNGYTLCNEPMELTFN